MKWTYSSQLCSAICCCVYASAVVIVSLCYGKFRQQLGFGQAIWQRQVDSKQAKRSCEGVEVEWDWCRAWWSSTHVATMHNTTLQLAAAAEVERRECSACHATFLQTGVSPVLVCICKRIKLLFLKQQASNSEKDLHAFHWFTCVLWIVKWIMGFEDIEW